MRLLSCFLVLLLLFSACHKNTTGKKQVHYGNENGAIPQLVWISAVQHDSLNKIPAVFYTPHQDDETIGMGVSIAEQSRLGNPVYVVLLTNGSNDNMLKYLQTMHASATMQEVTDARNNEFIAACKALGADRVYIANDGKGYDEKDSITRLVSEFRTTMNYFAGLFPDASHKTISGNCDSYNAACEKMPAHQAAATALHNLYTSGKIADASLFRVYFYYGTAGKCDKPCNWVKPSNAADKLKRQNAINEYKLVDEKNHRYGLGYWHSVGELFKNSWDSDLEQVDSMRND